MSIAIYRHCDGTHTVSQVKFLPEAPAAGELLQLREQRNVYKRDRSPL